MWRNGILVVLVYGIYYKNVVMLNWCFFFFLLVCEDGREEF